MVPHPPSPCSLGRIDEAELAWAAGFFDGEGSTIARTHKLRPGYRRLEVQVPQSGPHGVPAVLMRFQNAMLGMGRMTARRKDGTYAWRATLFEEAQATIALLWPFFGPIKRAQVIRAMRAVQAQYGSGGYRARRSRRLGHPHRFHLETCSRTPRSKEERERAWAAGFLDGEGSFGIVRSVPRKKAVAWHRIRVSADQRGDKDVPADVLTRLQRALADIGRIERHSESAFKWLAEGRANIVNVIEITGPWLGEVKQRQAMRALAAFDAQIRLKGDAEHCVRGHPYDRHVMRGGRMRKLCSRCAVINRAAHRERVQEVRVSRGRQRGLTSSANPKTSSRVYTQP